MREKSGAEQKIRDLRNLIEAHPEWADSDAIIALRQAGARFGPNEKQAFLSSLPFDKAERFLGRLKVTSVEFMHIDPKEEHYRALGKLEWRVEAETHFSDETDGEYVLAFEPFEGKLTYLFRRK